VVLSKILYAFLIFPSCSACPAYWYDRPGIMMPTNYEALHCVIVPIFLSLPLLSFTCVPQ
jgi:hypothetical protein